MIFIVVRFRVKPECADQWPDLTAEFTAATRAEEGNLWFEWSRSVDNPDSYVLVEAFNEGQAPAAHVQSAHFARMTKEFPAYLVETPQIISRQIEGNGWDRMGELTV